MSGLLLPPGAHETDAIRASKRALAEHPVAGSVTDHGGLGTFPFGTSDCFLGIEGG